MQPQLAPVSKPESRRIRGGRWVKPAIVLVCLAASGLMRVNGAAEEPAGEPAAIYDMAVESFNAGDIQRTRILLEDLLRAHPDYFGGYRLYWDAVGRVEDAGVRRQTVEKAVAYFEQIAVARRDDAFYQAFLEACRILNDQDRARTLRREAIERHPRGNIAQAALLDAARTEAERDPRRGAALLQDYLDRFDDNTSWTEVASRDLLRVMEAHPEPFSRAELLAAATQAERNQKRYIGEGGSPIGYVVLMKTLAALLVERAPSAALDYVNKGLAYVQEQWPAVGKDFEDTRRILWPALLRTHIALADWPRARTVGDALVAEIDAGTLTLSTAEESAARLDHATALDHTGDAEAALRQRELAADPQKASRLREEKLRLATLASEQRRPAKAFVLRDLSGKAVRLGDFRGKVLVLSFWATWCYPCGKELDALQELMGRYRSDSKVAFLAVSTDSSKDVVPPFVQKRGWTFPVALSDGSVEAPYKTQTIPRLFVIDRKGAIRFESTGFATIENFTKQVGWMIEAAKR